MLCAPLGDGQSMRPQEETQKRLRQTRLLLIIGARKKMHGSHTGPRGRETPSARRQEWQEERAEAMGYVTGPAGKAWWGGKQFRMA